jgi:hypothetical protein
VKTGGAFLLEKPMPNALELLAKAKKPEPKPVDEISFSLEDFQQTNVQALPDAPEPEALAFSMEDFQASNANHAHRLPSAPAPVNTMQVIDVGHKLPDGTEIELETVTRKTVEKMFRTTQLGEPFVFYVWAGRGEAYVFAIRTLISRTRERLRGRKHIEFKLNVVEMKRFGAYDRVTLCRNKPGPGSRQSQLYAGIEALWVGAGGDK